MIDVTQIADDLRNTFRGRLAFDAVRCGLYATDASPFEVTPLGVAFPLDAADLAVLVRYCHEHALPVVPRGAGTGVAGEALGPGLVVDLSAHFRSILRIDGDTATVEPGVVLAELNAVLATLGRRFAPDPASGHACTIGGMVATNASGGNAARHGYTRDHLRGLGVVWDDGTADRLGVGAADPTTRTRAITRSTEALLRANRELVHLTRPLTSFNRCGYVLHDVLSDAGLDLPRLLCGSEGTLAFVTEVTVATVPLPGGTCLALVGFPTLEGAVKAAADLRAFAPTAADILDRRLLSLTGRDAVPAAVGAALLVTFEADTEREAAEQAWGAIDALKAAHKLVVLADPACDPDGIGRIRAIRDAAVNGLYGLGRGPRPAAFVEDVGVPADALAEFLAGAQDVLKRFELSGSFLVHALAGQVHTRPLVDLADPADRAKLWPVAEAVHALALGLGGTVSSQHGTGIARTPWVEKQYGPILPVFRELKRIFDPKGVLNPGKIIGPDPSRPAWPLRGGNEPTPAEPRAPLTLWKDTTPEAEAGKCTGCGDCRPRAGRGRMCPAFTAAGLEEAAPRAMANLVRRLAADPAGLGADDAQPVVTACVNCKMCRDECASRVDVPRLMIEAKARRHADHGLDRVSWVLARADALAAFASRLAPLANGVLANRPARWVLEKLLGLSRRRRLPALAHRSFLSAVRGERHAVKPDAGADAPRVAYFVDTFANVFDPSIGAAAVAVLRHNGVRVVVPPRQRGSGAAPLAQGDLETARDLAVRNVRALAELVRDGYRIVCSEPTAALTLSQDYLLLLDDPDALAVAAATTELTTFLGDLHAAGRLRTDFRRLDLTLGHHVPCHVKALRGPAAGPGLLGLVPGLTVQTIDVSCSGMAGPWGLAEANYEASLRAGRRMIEAFDRPGLVYGATECGSCRLQMQEGTGKRAFHPVQYLAHAYGLMPDLPARLRRPLTDLVSD